MPTIYQSLPHLLMIGNTQNICANPVITKNVDVLESKPIKYCTKIRCKIPARAVKAAAAY